MQTVHNDERDLRAIGQGVTDRFWSLWDRHRVAVEAVCRRRLGTTPCDWRDAVQETLVRAWRTMPARSEDITDARGWLVRLAVWVCADQLRSLRRNVPLDLCDCLDGVAANRVIEDPRKAVERACEVREALRLIDALPPRLRYVCIAFHLEEQSIAEIAESLNTTERTVRAALNQARRALDADAPRSAEGAMAAIGEATRQVRAVTIHRADGLHVDYRADLDGPLATRVVRIDTLRRHVAQYPTGWKRRLELANLLFVAGDLDEAIAHLENVALKEPGRTDVLCRLAEALELSGRTGSALAAYDRAAQQARDPAQAARLRGLRARLAGDDSRALTELTWAAERAPRTPGIWHALAETHEHLHHYVEAVAAYDRALEIDADDTVALVRSHNGLCALGRYPEMMHRLERAVALDPNNAVALKLMAAHRTARGNITGVQGRATHRLIERVIRLAPDSADGWETLANFLVHRGEWKDARAVLRAYVQRHPGNGRGWYHLGIWQLNTGRPADALRSALEAIRLSPNWFEPYWLAINVAVLLRDVERLANLIPTILSRFRDLWDAHTTAGYGLAACAGQAERACAVSHRGVELAPCLPLAWSRHAEVLEVLGRWDDVVAALEQAWSVLEPGSHRSAAGIAVGLSRAWKQIGDGPAASPWHSAALELADERAREEPAGGLFLLAQAHHAAGHAEEAVRLFGALLAARPVWPVRREALRALRAMKR